MMNDQNTLELSQQQQIELEKQFRILSFGTTEITPLPDFKKMLAHAIKTNTPLRVKCGIDPTLATVHLGHTVPYRKMRQFQDLGHCGIVVIGDYTAQIGDPTGKTESRPALSSEEVKNFSQKYMEQIYKVVDPKKTEVRFQSEWFAKVSLAEVIKWAMETTVGKLLSHDTFRQRLEQESSLGLHELFYPVLQGIDSVFIKADVELGGSDQKFNVLMGRDYQKHRDMRPQVAMLMPIITGLCGTQKMSKSLGNFIGVQDVPFDMFGKVMSIPDQLMPEWAQYLSGWNLEQSGDFTRHLAAGILHPNEAKKQLAQSIVAYFYGANIGQEMRAQFESVFARKNVPDDVNEYQFKVGQRLSEVLVMSGLLSSNGEVKRLVQGHGLAWAEGEKITDEKLILEDLHRNKILKVGKKKFLKLI